MSEGSKEIKTLDELDTNVLHRRGWFMVTLYRALEGTDGSSAYNKAVERAQNHKRQAGLRTIVKDGVTYYEIWEHW